MNTDISVKSSLIDSPKTPIYILAIFEAAVTIGAGFLARSYSDPKVGGALGFCVWFAGGLITLSSAFLQLRFDAVMNRELRNVVGGELAYLREILRVFNVYHSVENNDLKKYRDEALEVAIHKLEALTRGEAEVEGDEYYLWLNEKVRTARTMRAVSCRPLRVYIEDNREKNWAHANETVAGGGTQITRIFILERGELVGQGERALIKRFILDSSVSVYVVWREHVNRAVLHQLVGGGFSIYDNQVVFFDRSYFETEVGLRDGEVTLNVPPRPVIPRASIYCKPHSQFNQFTTIFKGLEDLVPFSAKAGPAASYSHILQEVDAYLKGKYGTIEQLNNRGAEGAGVAAEWKALQEEIASLPSQKAAHDMVSPMRLPQAR